MPTLATRNEAEIRECIDGTAQAIRSKNINALMALYAPEVVTFDLMPLRTRGADASRKNFEAWFASVQGPIDYQVSELAIARCEDVAFCHYLGHVKSTRTTGEKSDYRVRVTASLRNTGGRWIITHEHISVPFKNGQAMRAALDQVQRRP